MIFRIIQNMQERRRAEMEQRDREFQAMKEDAAYTERLKKENYDIMMQNLRNEGMQKIADAKGEAAQAAIDNQAIQNIMGSIANFSNTAADYLAKQDLAKRKKEQADQQRREETGESFLVPYTTEKEEAEAAQAAGSIALNTEIKIDGIEGNRDPLDTLRSIAANPGSVGRESRISLNNSIKDSYANYYSGADKDTDRVYTMPDGRTFTAAEAKSNGEFRAHQGNILMEELLDRLNVTDRYYVRSSIEFMRNFNTSETNKARKEEGEFLLNQIERNASLNGTDGTVEGIHVAFSARSSAINPAAALDGFERDALDLSIPLEVFRSADLKGSGKTFDKEFPKRWAKIVQKRNDLFVKQQNADEALKKAEDREWVNSNIDAIQEAYNQNPNQAAALIKQRYHGKGMTVPPVISRIESAAIARNKDLIQHSILERTRFGILDLPFVNSIRDPQLQKQAREAFNAQEERKYGPEALGIKKGFKATARALTKINPNEEQGSAQTFLVQARLESEYLKQLQLTNDPLKALENVNKMVDAGNANDKSSPFYMDPGLGDNNRPVFPNIETSDREVAEMNTYIDKQLIQSGTAVVDKPFAIANSNQMDAAYASSLSGSVKYPPGILKVADQFGLKPSEVFNAHRQANNAATGANKPLLTPSPVVDIIDNSSPEMRKLFLSEEPAQINRASAVVTGRLPMRASMGGRSFNPASVPNNYGEPIAAAAERNNIPPDILAGLIATESDFNYKAVSPAGAQGLAQFMPPTAAEFGVDVNDPMSSIDGAARYLKYLIDYFNGDMEKAIYAYNGGMGNIERFGGPIPGNKENEEYLQKVLNNSTKYR
jgi:hypothetical protein